MKTLLKKWLAFAIVGTIIISFTSCGDDDSGPGPVNDTLIGSWELALEDDGPVDYILIITFQANGTYTEFTEDDFGSFTYSGTYSFLSEDQVQIDYGDGDFEVFTIILLTTSRLQVEDGDQYKYEFEKQ